MTVTIISIASVLLLCVVAITIMQKKEQERARIRQQVAKYRYRANTAAEILSNFAKVPVGHETRKMLMQYIQSNYQLASQLAPTDAQLQKNLETIEIALNNPPSPIDKQRLAIPSELEHVKILVGKLNTLAQFLLKIKAVRGVDPMLVNPAVSRLLGLISEAKICAYIMQGKDMLTRHEYVTAQRTFGAAKSMLDRMTQKDERIQTLEQELDELMKSTPTEAAKKPLSVEQAQPEQTKMKTEEEEDSIFGPRKKW